LGISLRTVYRDIAALQALGAQIEGEAGVGYVLRPSYFLPPLMFSPAEIEALTLGMRWVSTFADKPLARSADDALAKIEAVLPPDLRGGIGAMPLRVGPPPSETVTEEDLSELRRAIRDERKLEIIYRDKQGSESERVIWPFAVGYFADGRILVGWCELRRGFRHFRTTGIARARVLEDRISRRRLDLYRAWQRLEQGALAAAAMRSTSSG
jgi:predicted DNA-binding transcriptional regulator YafY